MANPEKKLVKLNVWNKTASIIEQRRTILNNDLKNLGVRSGLPKTRFMDMIVRNSTINLTNSDLYNLAKRGKR